MNGYVYIRNHEIYDKYDVCKLGITDNIPNRESTYFTSEYKSGYFNLVIEIDIKHMKIIEKMLHSYFLICGLSGCII